MKTLVITGGTGGLGTTVVARLQRGYRCIVLSRPATDISDEESVRRALKDAGSFYGLVHLAGGFAPGRTAETSLETWRQMIDLNATASFLVIREALRTIERPGRIVAISSEASLSKRPGSAAYTVSKSALNTLIEVAAAEAGGTGITVNALLPGTLDTPAMRAAMPQARRVPLEAVAEAIVFLLSPEAASVTGALIPLAP